jgi:hypothetical protein
LDSKEKMFSLQSSFSNWIVNIWLSIIYLLCACRVQSVAPLAGIIRFIFCNITFITHYYPKVEILQRIIGKHWHLIKNDPTIGTKFKKNLNYWINSFILLWNSISLLVFLSIQIPSPLIKDLKLDFTLTTLQSVEVNIFILI